MTHRMGVFFAGCGGDAQGSATVPGVDVVWAGNHWQLAVDSHQLNFPNAEHFCGDIQKTDLHKLPAWDLFWASPECTKWSQARGKKRDYDKQPGLFGDPVPDEATERSRALMWDVPRYLESVQTRGRLVLAGVVENVIDERSWILFDTWVQAIQVLGYRTRLIALNSMHARPRTTPLAPQSRDRLYLAYWHKSLGRDPDWGKWLRPQAWCPSCEQTVAAVQSWKKPSDDMGRYRQQYVYRCPKASCRGQLVEPAVLPAAAAIDWNLRGQRIGDRKTPLKPKTMARIRAGFERYAQPITLETATKTVAVPPFITINRAGERTTAIVDPLTTVTVRGTQHSLVIPPFVVLLRSGRNRTLDPATDPLATVVADGAGHGLVTPPFLTILRGRSVAQPVSDPLSTVTTNGAHHGLVVPDGDNPAGYLPLGMLVRQNTPRGNPVQMCSPVTEPARTLTTAGHQSLVSWAHLLMPYYNTGVCHPVSEPASTLTAKDRLALISGALNVEDALFRMLQPHEISRAMAFGPAYKILGNKTEQTAQLGNAVTPPVAEVIVSALVEAISGEALPR